MEFRRWSQCFKEFCISIADIIRWTRRPTMVTVTLGSETVNFKFKQFVEATYWGWGPGTEHCILAPLMMHWKHFFASSVQYDKFFLQSLMSTADNILSPHRHFFGLKTTLVCVAGLTHPPLFDTHPFASSDTNFPPGSTLAHRPPTHPHMPPATLTISSVYKTPPPM